MPKRITLIPPAPPGADGTKPREILLARFPPDQLPGAVECLAALAGLTVTPDPDRRRLLLRYQLGEHSLEALENHLMDHGFHLDNSLFSKLRRALIHYVEETRWHNHHTPVRLTKGRQASPEAYAQAWERHPHGDHDDTPAEWREYR